MKLCVFHFYIESYLQFQNGQYAVHLFPEMENNHLSRFSVYGAKYCYFMN